METWQGRGEFSYTGSVQEGVQITYGKGWKVSVSAKDFARLLEHFAGKTVQMGTSRTNPQPGSVGEWLQANVTKTAIASYVGPILIHEQYAQRVHDTASIRFFERRGV
jgi:hypothetical protein